MNTVTIKANGQTLSMSSEDALALEAALIDARKSPNQDIHKMTNTGVILVSSKAIDGQHFSKAIRPSDCILALTPKPMFSANQVTLTDC